MTMDERQRLELTTLCSDVHLNADMGTFTTFRTGGRVEALVNVGEIKELAALLGWLGRERIPWRIIGGGSNILVTSGIHPGVFLRLQGSFCNIARLADAGAGEVKNCILRVGGGSSLARLVKWCEKHSVTGMEWAVGIPGTVGGGIRMNAGAHGSDMATVLSVVSVVTAEGQSIDVQADRITFAYRSTQMPILETGAAVIIAGAELSLQYSRGGDVGDLMRAYREERKANQPTGASAGSFFKNPKGDAAGRLIEKAGLKGVRHGGALVSPVHANFIINTGSATPEDILALKDMIQQKVLQESGILLEPEVHII